MIKKFSTILLIAILTASSAQAQTSLSSNWQEAQELINKTMKLCATRSHNGDAKYKGGKLNGKFTGLGAYYWNNKNFYIGEWNNDIIDGFGIFIMGNFDTCDLTNCPDCKIYVGDWLNGEKSGPGRCYNKNGRLIYEGNFKDDKPTGTYSEIDAYSPYRFKVIKYFDNSYYVGETYNGKRHGKGIRLLKNGTIWCVDYKLDELSGYGTKIYPDGNMSGGRWEGNIYDRYIPNHIDIYTYIDSLISYTWQEVHRLISKAINSNPTYTYEDGNYKGEMSNGNFNGLGARYWSNTKDFYFGEYAQSKRNGYGIYMVGSLDDRHVSNCYGATIYVGGWSNSDKSGTGTCYDNTGKLIYVGKFENNKPTGTYPTKSRGYSAYGFNIIKYPDDSYYVGETYKGKRHGKGIMLWQNGDIWYDEWKDDERTDYGIEIYANGTMKR